MPTSETNDIIIRIFRMFLLITMGSQPFVIIVNYINHLYQAQSNEPINFTYLYFIDKIFILVVLLILLHFTKKTRKIIIAFITNLAIAIILLEFFSVSRPKFVGYFIFYIILNFNKSLCLVSEINIKIYEVSNIVIFLYIVIRTVIFKVQDITFPLFYSISLIVDYVITEIPVHLLFYNYSKFMTHKNSIINDFKTLINLIPNPIVMYDTAHNTISLSNQATQSKLSEKLLQQIITLALESPIPSTGIKFAHSDFSYSISTSRFETTSVESNSVIISVVDITEISQNERKKANEDAMWLFINAANHQIRTPLSGIESSLTLLQEALDTNDKISIQSNIEVAMLSAMGLRHLFDDTLLFCEDKENKIVINNERFTMQDITSFLKQVFTFETFRKNLVLNVEESECHQVLIGDKKHIVHIIYTFMSNAFKYTLEGEITFTYQIEIKGQNTKLIIKISDTGLGIENDEIKHLFNPFENSKYNKTEEKASTGISLHIAKRLCSLMGGDITLQSTIGKGTTFCICLPIAVTKLEQYITHQRSSEFTGSPTHSNKNCAGSTVLVVDDNTTNLFVLTSMLTKLGIAHDAAHNGEEAVNKFKEGYYKLVMMDINMPIMNGYEASRIIKELQINKKYKAKVIAVSAQDSPLDDKMMKECEIEKWLVKPVKMTVLKDLLKENSCEFEET